MFHWCDYYLTLRIKYCLQANGQMVLAALSLFQRITTYVDWVRVQRGCMSEGVLSLQMLWTCIFLKTVSWYLSGHIPHKLSTRGFNEHRRLTKHVGYIAQTSRLLFPPKKKQIFWIMSWAKIEFFHAEIYVTYSRIVICSLLAGIDCVANKSKFD